MKRLLILLMLASTPPIACSIGPPPDREATVQAEVAATQVALPTDTPVPTPTDTPAPTATSQPTDTPPPTDTPAPTATPSPEPTATPTNTPAPTETPTSTLAPTPAPQPTATPQPAPPPPPAGEAVSLYPFCNCREEVAAGQPIELAYSWITVESQQAADYLQFTRRQLTLDGQTLGNVDQYWSDVTQHADGYQVRWQYPLGTLDVGTHRVELTVSADSAFTDGFDSDGDGQPDVYGPGSLQGWIEIVVSAPAAPPGVDIPPDKALFVFINYTDKDWNVDIIGEPSYFLAVPPNQSGQEYAIATIAIDPGTYIWKAGSPLGFYIRDANGNTDFQFSVSAGEVHTARVR
jgi:hypothetical protein